MGAPPLLDGAAKVTVELEFPAVALTPVGAPGTVTGATGVTVLDAAEATLVPVFVVMVALKLYETPLVKPLTTTDGLLEVTTIPPGLEVTV